MSTPPSVPQALLTELTGSLDEQIELLELRRRQLETLTGCLQTRDYHRVETLLEEIEQTQQRHRGADLRLQACRQSLARCVGVSLEAFSLGILLGDLPQEQAAGLDYRRERLRLLAGELTERNFQAAIVLHESAQVNRMLLRCLLATDEGVQTYGAGGRSVCPADGGVIDARR